MRPLDRVTTLTDVLFTINAAETVFPHCFYGTTFIASSKEKEQRTRRKTKMEKMLI